MRGEDLTGSEQMGNETLKFWHPTWVYNCTENHDLIMDGLASGRINDLGLREKAALPALVIGSGPSLDRTRWDALRIAHSETRVLIICATSNMSCLLAHGITPDFVMVVDASPDTGTTHIDDIGGSNATRKIELIAPPTADPQLLRRWRGPITVYKPIQLNDPFIMQALPYMYATRTDAPNKIQRIYTEALNLGLMNAGCVVNGAVLVANTLACEPVGLLGVDFGMYGGQGWATRYKRTKGGWQAYPFHAYRARDLLRKSKRPGVYTTTEMMQYKLNLFYVWKVSYELPLVMLSDRSIVRPDEIPTLNWEGDKSPLETFLDDPEQVVATYPFHEPELSAHIQRCVEALGVKVQQGEGVQAAALETSTVPPPVAQAIMSSPPSGSTPQPSALERTQTFQRRHL